MNLLVQWRRCQMNRMIVYRLFLFCQIYQSTLIPCPSGFSLFCTGATYKKPQSRGLGFNPEKGPAISAGQMSPLDSRHRHKASVCVLCSGLRTKPGPKPKVLRFSIYFLCFSLRASVEGFSSGERWVRWLGVVALGGDRRGSGEDALKGPQTAWRGLWGG